MPSKGMVDAFSLAIIAQVTSTANKHSEVTTKVTTRKPSRKAKQVAGDMTPFAMSLFYKSMMRIDIHQYGLKLDNANITFNQYVDSYIRLQGGGNDGEIRVTSSNQEAAYDFDSTGELPGWGQSTDTILIGKKGTVYSLYDDSKPPAKRNAPNLDGTPIFDSKDAVSCSAGEELKCVLLSKLSDYDSTLKNDPETVSTFPSSEYHSWAHYQRHHTLLREYRKQCSDYSSAFQHDWNPIRSP